MGITILMKKVNAPTNLFKFLSVLETSVWGCILGAYFVTSVLLWAFDRWSPYSYQNNMKMYEVMVEVSPCTYQYLLTTRCRTMTSRDTST